MRATKENTDKKRNTKNQVSYTQCRVPLVHSSWSERHGRLQFNAEHTRLKCTQLKSRHVSVQSESPKAANAMMKQTMPARTKAAGIPHFWILSSLKGIGN